MTSLYKSVTVDSDKWEAVRAKLRLMVETLLRRYKLPPDKRKEATETVLKQAGLALQKLLQANGESSGFLAPKKGRPDN